MKESTFKKAEEFIKIYEKEFIAQGGNPKDLSIKNCPFNGWEENDFDDAIRNVTQIVKDDIFMNEFERLL
ncbi:MAG: hypothetical protein JSU91_01955 [Thermoplasmatales archaeon]|nr:MAG: hypothetical protein JSU91_01955 [Thermoplasmatales archaeon]